MTVCEICGQIEMMTITQPCFECRALNKEVEQDHACEFCNEFNCTCFDEEDTDECEHCGEYFLDCEC